MTREQIWDWQCRVFIYSCYLYEVESAALLSDEHYDQHSLMLLKAYDQLPQWFTDRVPRNQLEAGTSVGLTYSQQDINGAHEWVRTAQRWRDHYGLPRKAS